MTPPPPGPRGPTLLPCPFCNGEAKPNLGRTHVRCQNEECSMSARFFPLPAWNRRAPSPSAVAAAALNETPFRVWSEGDKPSTYYVDALSEVLAWYPPNPSNADVLKRATAEYVALRLSAHPAAEREAEYERLRKDSDTLKRLRADYERASDRMEERFCDNLRTWRNAIDASTERKGQWSPENVAQIDTVFLWIRKSDLLNRLVYRGEKLRTRMCPVHKGRWSGLPSEPPPCGCGLTGWLPEEPASSPPAAPATETR